MNIVFIQPSKFLRTKDGVNPFFDPLIHVVEKLEAGWKWTVWIPKNEKVCGYPGKHVRRYGLIEFWDICFWRACHLLCPLKDQKEIHRFFGRVARPFFREWAQADVIITIAGVFAHELVGAFPDKRVVDLQHGVIFSKHRGYFNTDSSMRLDHRTNNHREFWLYGQGYADCFFKNPENHKWLDGRVKVVGDLLHANHSPTPTSCSNSRKVIAVSLQFTDDFSLEVQQSWADDLSKVFEQIEAAGLLKRYPVVMRHHPRYTGKFDMTPMMTRFPWLTITKETTPELIARAAYHITYGSTAAFEYAAEGVPTLFTASEKNRWATDIMYGEYGYPIPLAFDALSKALSDPQEMARQSELVKAWYRKFYTPFDEENCLKLLKGIKEKNS